MKTPVNCIITREKWTVQFSECDYIRDQVEISETTNQVEISPIEIIVKSQFGINRIVHEMEITFSDQKWLQPGKVGGCITDLQPLH